MDEGRHAGGTATLVCGFHMVWRRGSDDADHGFGAVVTGTAHVGAHPDFGLVPGWSRSVPGPDCDDRRTGEPQILQGLGMLRTVSAVALTDHTQGDT